MSALQDNVKKLRDQLLTAVSSLRLQAINELREQGGEFFRTKQAGKLELSEVASQRAMEAASTLNWLDAMQQTAQVEPYMPEPIPSPVPSPDEPAQPNG